MRTYNLRRQPALEGGCENAWEMVKITLLIRLCQVYSRKLPETFLLSFKISEFEALGSSICRLLYAGFYYLLINWLAYLYGQIQSPRPDVIARPKGGYNEGITRAAGFVFARTDTQASW